MTKLSHSGPSPSYKAVQNERDRISSRRPSYDEPVPANGLTVSVLINAETMSRQVKKKEKKTMIPPNLFSLSLGFLFFSLDLTDFTNTKFLFISLAFFTHSARSYCSGNTTPNTKKKTKNFFFVVVVFVC